MKYHFLTILSLLTLQVFAQIPQREIVFPNSVNLNLGRQYKSHSWLLNEDGLPKDLMPYFNYEDFEDFEPIAYLIVDNPYNTVEDLNSIPKDKMHEYYQRSIDSSTVDFLSKLLFHAKEPVLNNHYLGHETYRFTWTRSFDDDYIITLSSRTNEAEIRINQVIKKTGKIKKSIKKIDINEFEEFKSKLINSNFWIMKSYEWVLGLDGSRWTIEAHVPLSYKVLSRFSPDLMYEDQLILRQLGKWLIDKSEINVNEIY